MVVLDVCTGYLVSQDGRTTHFVSQNDCTGHFGSQDGCTGHFVSPDGCIKHFVSQYGCTGRYVSNDGSTSHFVALDDGTGPNYNIGLKVYINSNSFTGYALAGMSGVLSQDQSKVFLGGPYAFYAQGMLLSMESSGRGNLVANKLTFGQAELDNSVEGWALVRGTFSSSTVEFLAASHVGYNSGHGKVSFYDALVLKEASTSLYGQEMGAQFGYCLESADVDGDGVDDLLVGAPLARAGDKLLADAGKIYLYYSPLVQNSPRASPLILEGQVAWGRFGHSVTCPGDLNHDGFKGEKCHVLPDLWMS
nr:integrin alpha-5-like [Cherax quadricarinatus]